MIQSLIKEFSSTFQQEIKVFCELRSSIKSFSPREAWETFTSIWNWGGEKFMPRVISLTPEKCCSCLSPCHGLQLKQNLTFSEQHEYGSRLHLPFTFFPLDFLLEVSSRFTLIEQKESEEGDMGIGKTSPSSPRYKWMTVLNSNREMLTSLPLMDNSQSKGTSQATWGLHTLYRQCLPEVLQFYWHRAGLSCHLRTQQWLKQQKTCS